MSVALAADNRVVRGHAPSLARRRPFAGPNVSSHGRHTWLLGTQKLATRRLAEFGASTRQVWGSVAQGLGHPSRCIQPCWSSARPYCTSSSRSRISSATCGSLDDETSPPRHFSVPTG